MSKIKLSNGVIYPIADYATPSCFVILLGSVTVSEVLGTMTEENLSEIQFLTDSGAITGTYYNQLLCNYVENDNTLIVNINDADLCRYGLILNEDSRIINAPAQRYASEGAIIVDTLPEGNPLDYLYINNEFIYNPLPKEEIIEQPTQNDLIEAQITYTAMMTDTLLV